MYTPKLSEAIVQDFLSEQEIGQCRKEAYIQEWPCTDCDKFGPTSGEKTCGEKAYDVIKAMPEGQEMELVRQGQIPAAILYEFVRRCEELCFKRMNRPMVFDPSVN